MISRKIILTISFLVIFCFPLFADDVSQKEWVKINGWDCLKGEVILKFKDAQGARTDLEISQERQRLLDLYGAEMIEKWRIGAELWRFESQDTEKVIDALTQNFYIEYAEPNYVVHADLIPNDSSFSKLWGMNNTGQTGGKPDADIDAPEAWNVVTGDSNVVVGVIDSGVNYNHPDLNDNMWRNPGEIPNNRVDDDRNGYVDDVYGYDFVNGDGDPLDDNGHGTHVAGTIGAEGNNATGVVGVVWDVQIMALKIFNAEGEGSTADAISAVEYSTMMGVDVTNNSWGGGGYSSALRNAIYGAHNAGILFIAAAGNGGDDRIGDNNDQIPNYPSNYDAPNIIAVAATDHNDRKASFSNYGQISVDLGAPGVSIYSTYGNSYTYFNGTSMATPHVTGLVALVRSAFPSFNHMEIKDKIMSTVDPVSDLFGRTVTGGRINAFKAIQRGGGPADDLDLQNHTVQGSENYEATNSITAHNNFIVPNGTVATFKAGNVIYLQDGFQSQTGSDFQAQIGPVE